MAGHSEAPLRLACRRCGCRYAFTPLVDAGSLVHRVNRNRRLLFRSVDEPWLGVQVLGSTPQDLAQAARLLNDFEFDVLDLNLGCPVAKVTRRGAGAALGAAPDRAARCLQAMADVSRFPVTAKIRVLDQERPAPTLELCRKLEAAGAQAVTIHGRTWDQIYTGPVSVRVIAAVADVLRVPIIANGGVVDRMSAENLRLRSTCSRIMVARGALGNPWIFRELTGPAAAVPNSQPTNDELCEQVVEHVRGLVELHGEMFGMRYARKIILSYLTGRGYRRQRRGAVTGLSTWTEFREFMRDLRDEGVSPSFQPPS